MGDISSHLLIVQIYNKQVTLLVTRSSLKNLLTTLEKKKTGISR